MVVGVVMVQVFTMSGTGMLTGGSPLAIGRHSGVDKADRVDKDGGGGAIDGIPEGTSGGTPKGKGKFKGTFLLGGWRVTLNSSNQSLMANLSARLGL